MGYVFGPVPSRRLGRSLGVDLVPFKTCTYDCIYCQLGRTNAKTLERQEWHPLERILEDLRVKLASKPDYITLGGSGEPTLYSRLDELIDRIRSMTDIPVAVLTNGSLLWQQDLRRQLLDANLVIPSLDAGNSTLFHAINRPHKDITFEMMLDGLIRFRQEFKGAYWLEVFMLDGLNAVEGDARKLFESAKYISPDRIQLNTTTRPPAEDYAYKVDQLCLKKIAGWSTPPAEVIAEYRGIHDHGVFIDGAADVLDMVQRRPCSIADISNGLDMHKNEVVKYIEELSAQGLVEAKNSSDKVFYFGKHSVENPRL